MQNYKSYILISLLAFAGCIQKKYKKNVVCNLNVTGIKNIKKLV